MSTNSPIRSEGQSNARLVPVMLEMVSAAFPTLRACTDKLLLPPTKVFPKLTDDGVKVSRGRDERMRVTGTSRLTRVVSLLVKRTQPVIVPGAVETVVFTLKLVCRLDPAGTVLVLVVIATRLARVAEGVAVHCSVASPLFVIVRSWFVGVPGSRVSVIGVGDTAILGPSSPFPVSGTRVCSAPLALLDKITFAE